MAIEPVLNLFRSVAYAGAGVPGRKTLIWLTTTAPFNVDAKTHLLESPFIISRRGAITLSTGVDPSRLGPAAVSGMAATQSDSGQALLTPDQVKRLLPLWRATVNALVANDVAVFPVDISGSENVAVADSLFKFSPPEGVEVVEESSADSF